MPSRLHEDLLRLFQNRPVLAAELIGEALQRQLPDYSDARVTPRTSATCGLQSTGPTS